MVPEHTTITLLRARDSRSVEISMVFSAPICAPPMPLPQATGIPAIAAVCTAAAMVMTPSDFLARRIGMSRADALKMEPLLSSRYRISSSVSPTWIWPFRIAVKAGTAPASRTVLRMRKANSAIPGYIMPPKVAALSMTTTGRPSAIAFSTSSENTIYPSFLFCTGALLCAGDAVESAAVASSCTAENMSTKSIHASISKRISGDAMSSPSESIR